MGAVERGELRWKPTKLERLDAVAIDQAGDLYTPIARQIFDQPAIADIAIDHLRTVQRVTLNDVRASVQAPFEIKCPLTPPFAFQVVTQPLVMFRAIGGPPACAFAAPAVRLHAHIILDQILPFAKIRNVFRDMPAGFGGKVSKGAHESEANRVLLVY